MPTTMLKRCTVLSAVLLVSSACASAGGRAGSNDAMRAEAIAQATRCMKGAEVGCLSTSRSPDTCEGGEQWLVVRNLSGSALGLYEFRRGSGSYRLVTRVAPGTTALRTVTGRALTLGSLEHDPLHAPASEKPLVDVRMQGVCVRPQAPSGARASAGQRRR